MLTQGRFIFSAVLSMLVSSAAVAGCPVPKDLDVSLMLINFKGALVSEKLAEQIAWAFFQERYSPSGIFEAKPPAELVDLDDRWAVKFQNALFDPSVDLTKRLQVKAMSVEICKSNGAIFRIK